VIVMDLLVRPDGHIAYRADDPTWPGSATT
jgi:hypothetical protein